MTRDDAIRFAELAVRIARAQPELNAEQCADLLSRWWAIAGRCAAYAEACCNREMADAEHVRETARRETLRRETSAKGLDVRFQNDPRGYVVRLVFPGDSCQEGRGVR